MYVPRFLSNAVVQVLTLPPHSKKRSNSISPPRVTDNGRLKNKHETLENRNNGGAPGQTRELLFGGKTPRGHRPVAMPRLAVLISGCSVCLVASWAMVAIHQANQGVAQIPPGQGAPVARTAAGEASAASRAARADALGLAHPQSPGRDERREELERLGRQAPPAKKKRTGARGIAVDRKNIVETVEMDDLRAPPGRLWIPAALSGPINNKGGDPLFNVLVAYCQLDMVAYHESPWLFAMGAFHQRTSGCLDDPSLTRTYRLSSLKVST